MIRPLSAATLGLISTIARTVLGVAVLGLIDQGLYVPSGGGGSPTGIPDRAVWVAPSANMPDMVGLCVLAFGAGVVG
jgi:hypothetical protein